LKIKSQQLTKAFMFNNKLNTSKIKIKINNRKLLWLVMVTMDDDDNFDGDDDRR